MSEGKALSFITGACVICMNDDGCHPESCELTQEELAATIATLTAQVEAADALAETDDALIKELLKVRPKALPLIEARADKRRAYLALRDQRHTGGKG